MPEQSAFVKTRADAPPGFFELEAEGLNALGNAGTLAVPRVLEVSSSRIVLERVDARPWTPLAWERLGRGLAELHRATRSDRHGWHRDGWLGRTPQPNAQTADGASFWTRRLAHLTRLLGEAGRLPPRLEQAAEAACAHLPALLPDEPPCLVHGDLWSGNVLCGPDQTPYLIDPAIHRTYREADLAMARLFGGFGARFFDAYAEAWPLPGGWAERVPLFQAYHLLNHAVLFGGGYAAQAQAALERVGNAAE